ncbi:MULTISPECIES: ABC transporter substrate-binding protein [Chelativorans]|jgi:ABC transporter substrate binding protein (PQQ-dependent alcohol dehydrogenase system)|uniref:Amino acid/amide ABC transporter substrate-binding protein, HAAT family n=1 Tax=Chelativorans sp. (strain BNC1) TaxID=266779 RepID=Q11F32_CHESB|nr:MULTISPECIES: ABC transporter substrate-binding protein [Chelativorans]
MSRKGKQALLPALLAGSLALAVALPSFSQEAAPSAGQKSASPQEPAQATKMLMGYVELADDPRYDEDYAYAQVPVRPLGRPFDATAVGIADAAQIGKVIGVDFAVERKAGENVEELVTTVQGWSDQGIGFVLADLPAAQLLQLADALRDKDVMIFNLAAREDALRGENCRANLVHVIPSYAMVADALVQYLSFRNWRNILVLQGPLDGDAQMVAVVQRAAQRFGARIVEVRPFQLTNDPRRREQSNVALVTANADYDVVLVADTDGEFARYVPFATQFPRPVVGAAGLVPSAWHWSWERHGAPQLNSRFERAAGRRMGSEDWAAWTAIKAVVQSVLRSKSTEFQPVRDYLLGERLNLDGFKGNPLSVRSWDHQIRQPILLSTGNAVIERAPLEGFLHQTNDLDTLGMDAPETACQF